jgi:hypothetical protein
VALDSFDLQRSMEREGIETSFLNHDQAIILLHPSAALRLQQGEPLLQRFHIASSQLHPGHSLAGTG